MQNWHLEKKEGTGKPTDKTYFGGVINSAAGPFGSVLKETSTFIDKLPLALGDGLSISLKGNAESSQKSLGK